MKWKRSIPNCKCKTYSKEFVWCALGFILDEVKSINKSKFSLQIIHKLAKFYPADDDTKSLSLFKAIFDEIRRN